MLLPRETCTNIKLHIPLLHICNVGVCFSKNNNIIKKKGKLGKIDGKLNWKFPFSFSLYICGRIIKHKTDVCWVFLLLLLNVIQNEWKLTAFFFAMVTMVLNWVYNVCTCTQQAFNYAKLLKWNYFVNKLRSKWIKIFIFCPRVWLARILIGNT